MKSPPFPEDEDARLRSLKDMEILDTPAEDRFDCITRIARRVFETEYAAVNLIDSDRQWGKSSCGIDNFNSPREESFCAHAILDEESTIILDATRDERFSDNPFVTGSPGIRFYMGHPVHSPDGHAIGTLCVIDTAPRESVSEEDRRVIEDLASLVDSELQRGKLHDVQAELRHQLSEAERRSRIDDLTDLWNRRAIREMLDAELNRSERSENSLGIVMLDIDDFKLINDTHGHSAGDEVLRRVAEVLRKSVRDYDAVGRYGGEEFLALLTEAAREQAHEIGERIRREVQELTVDHNGKDLSVTVSLGITVGDVNDELEAEELVEEADEALYHSKETGKNRVCFYSELEDGVDD